jgi:glucokinase
MASWVLAGDVGGTKTNLAVYRFEERRKATQVREETFPSRGTRGSRRSCALSWGSSASPWQRRVRHRGRGPGPGGEGHQPAWKLHEERLAEEIGCERVRLLNDLETTAYGALFLEPEELHTLNAGVPRKAHRAVIAAGTGLGQAILFWDSSRHHPAATEGGRRFAPRSGGARAAPLPPPAPLARLLESACSPGPGLRRIFEFLRARDRR